jgi:hypothetical protein
MIRVDGTEVMHERPLVSLVVPCFNEQEVLPLLVERLQALARSLETESGCDAEFLPDDGGRRRRELNRLCCPRH